MTSNNVKTPEKTRTSMLAWCSLVSEEVVTFIPDLSVIFPCTLAFRSSFKLALHSVTQLYPSFVCCVLF